MPDLEPIHSIAAYMVEHHPLEQLGSEDGFHWIGDDEGLKLDLQNLIGPFKLDEVSILIDEEPAGASWDRLLTAVLAQDVRTVITHLALLSSAQRQQLIGVCAQSGAQLITPSDAGRNREGETLSHG
ncbi:MAG: hypothetical protein WBR18_09005 [Anaerolineales bacterium]